MDKILFESFSRVNNMHFNNEYKLIAPRFISFFSKYSKEWESEEQLGNILSSYYQCLNFFQKVMNFDSTFTHLKNNVANITISREIIVENGMHAYYLQNIATMLILLKKDQLGSEEDFSELNYKNYIKEINEQKNSKQYIKTAFENILSFLEKWIDDLYTNVSETLLEKCNKKVKQSKNFFVTESACKVVSNLLVAKEYCGDLLWPVDLNAENSVKALAEFVNISSDVLRIDLSNEIFFNKLFIKNSVYCHDLNDFIKKFFNEEIFEALLSNNPEQYLLNSLLEKLPTSMIEPSLFSYLQKDLNAINEGIIKQSKFKVLLHGVAGAGKTELSKVISKMTNKEMYRLKIKNIVQEEKKLQSISEKLITLLMVNDFFKNNNFILLIDECEEFFENDNKLKEQINYILDQLHIPCIFIANEIKNFHPSYLRRFNYHVNMDVCDFNQKITIVKKYFGSDFKNEEVINFIAGQSITNADIFENVEFFKATNNINYLRQKIDNKQITQDMMQLNGVEKSIYNFITPENNNFNFDTIIGYKEERKNLLSVNHYLKNKEKYLKMNVKMPHGSILYGFPGTGKTSIIKALAKKCDLPVISVATGMMENDASGALNIKKIFNLAKKNTPCMILLDEFEKMALNRKLEMQNGTSQSLMNQLLMEMDDIYQNNNDVFVYATCNTVSYIDPAISRSGRLEQMTEIGLPNADVREQMFKSLLGKEIKLKGMKQIVQHTTGFSFVDIQSIVNNYKIAILKSEGKGSKHNLLMKEIHEFLLGKTTTGKLQKEEKELVAYHESGHAFLAYLFDKAVGNISIIPKSGYLGVTLMLSDESKHIRSKEDIEKELMILMAGRASEVVFLSKETTGSGDDFRRATKLAMSNLNVLAEKEVGLMDIDISEYNEKFSESYKIKVEKSVNNILQNLYQKTKNVLAESKEEIESMVARLLKNEEMIQNEMEGLLHATMTAKNVTKMSKVSYFKS